MKTGWIKNAALPFTVFITGACVLIIEVLAVRILSPYYGNTIFTVSSVISVILGALSTGYYMGGKLADRSPSIKQFFGIILVSGLTLLLFHLFSTIALAAVSRALPITTGPLVSAFLLFFLPALLLGTLSPYAIKLHKTFVPEEGVGTAAGKIFFWGTTGSIVGSLSAGFILIPRFGIDKIMIGNGITLFLLGFVPLLTLGAKKKNLMVSVFIFLTFISALLPMIQRDEDDIVFRKDGVYEKITVYDGEYKGRPVRFFQQDRSSSGAMFLDTNDPADLVYDYTKYYALYKIFTPEAKNALVIGGGAYSIPKALLAELPEGTVDVAEIEPSLFTLAQKYFKTPESPRLKTFAEDGRRLLTTSPKKYDIMISDVYYSLFSIPAHFTTREFFTLAKEKLNKEGTFIANLIGSLPPPKGIPPQEKQSLILSELKTFQTIFPNNYVFAVDSPKKTGTQNIILVGHKSGRKIDIHDPEIRKHPNQTIQELYSKEIDVEVLDFSPYPILTDNFAPMEHLTAKMLE